MPFKASGFLDGAFHRHSASSGEECCCGAFEEAARWAGQCRIIGKLGAHSNSACWTWPWCFVDLSFSLSLAVGLGMTTMGVWFVPGRVKPKAAGCEVTAALSLACDWFLVAAGWGTGQGRRSCPFREAQVEMKWTPCPVF